ncbi:hypothetical protein [Jannaschia sp. M317]|uniref:hypothetical protein n=1 Tax=Jannaschia sp. M317 TaxID=2867011 RepID=UPI0021A5ADBC|nr:hypothetical protein [Jannaschia sp. M317]UWQ19259.1 hypothetical protein K3551_08320 [Jannaschia sp. M317]
MVNETEIEALLRNMGDDTVPLGAALRSAVIEDAIAMAPRPVPWWRSISLWGGALGAPVAALCGLWLGIAQPALVLQAVPGMDLSATEALTDGEALLDDIYGGSWEDWL